MENRASDESTLCFFDPCLPISDLFFYAILLAQWWINRLRFQTPTEHLGVLPASFMR
jgi:hypothetical protein